MKPGLKEVSAGEFADWCNGYPRRLHGGERVFDGELAAFIVPLIDPAVDRHQGAGQLVAYRQLGGVERYFVREEVPAAAYRVRPDGSCDHEWNPSEAGDGKLSCDYCGATTTPTEAREAILVRRGEDETKAAIVADLKLAAALYQDDPHPLAEHFERVVMRLADRIETDAYKQTTNAWIVDQKIKPKVCPTCMRTALELGHEATVRERREMTPIFSLPEYSDADWYADVVAALPTATERRELERGLMLDFGHVRVTIRRGDRSRVENKITGAYALVDGFGPAGVVAAELAFLLPSVGVAE